MRVELAPSAYLVGPNSAGKSTVVETIALVERCLQRARVATKRLTTEMHRHERRYVLPVPLSESEEIEDPVRHNFGDDEALVTVTWDHGGSVTLVWREVDHEFDRTDAGFFHLSTPRGLQPSSREIKELFPPITVVPVLTPLERNESLRKRTYIRAMSRTRLASRHFRNHAFQMQEDGEWQAFLEFAAPWCPELELMNVEYFAGEDRLAIFYREGGSRVQKELAWAGDGLQIWLQLLWHVYRARGSHCVVLDEPEVYLHPDLQRRLVRLLESLSTQILLATHSAEVIAEAPPEAVVWIDRRANRSSKPSSHAALSALTASLGTGFNIALARAARSRVVLATDVEDLRVLRTVAHHIGALRLASEQTITVVQLRQHDAWLHTPEVGRHLAEAIPPGVPALVLLEAGYLSAEAMDAVRHALVNPSIEVLTIARASLTNYLLEPEILERASGADVYTLGDRLQAALEAAHNSTRAKIAAAAVRTANNVAAADALKAAEAAFDTAWHQPDYRTAVADTAIVLQSLNAWLSREGYRVVTPLSLARAVRPADLATDLFTTLMHIDDRSVEA